MSLRKTQESLLKITALPEQAAARALQPAGLPVWRRRERSGWDFSLYFCLWNQTGLLSKWHIYTHTHVWLKLRSKADVIKDSDRLPSVSTCTYCQSAHIGRVKLGANPRIKPVYLGLSWHSKCTATNKL